MFGWLGSAFTGKQKTKQPPKEVKKIRLGICAMDKKAQSKPMREILKRFPSQLFEIVFFGDDLILNKPIEEWPRVEVLIAFYSSHYPTDKALEYVKQTRPFMINDLEMDKVLKDRRKVYELLESQQIDVPKHVFCNRDSSDAVDTNVIEEFDEYVVINGVHLNKPLVEKPVDAEDHNIYIYYPMSAGGGSKRLFRKVDDRSSTFFPHENELRKEGSYIYEEFVVTQGTDVKVYTVGPDYGHAEARKSPVVDGKVIRDSAGLEVRYPVILSPAEKEIARKIVTAFKQTVCGFDILRVQGRSYCCDVNGFSFVKKSSKYYDDASQLLVEIMIKQVRPELHITSSTQMPLTRVVHTSNNQDEGGSLLQPKKKQTQPSAPTPARRTVSSTPTPGEAAANIRSTPGVGEGYDGRGSPTEEYGEDDRQEELRCVIAVIRHGDRTPKQKMKVKVTEKRYLDYFHSYAKNSKKDVKVKSKVALLRFLEVTREIVADPEVGKNKELIRQLRQIKDVLERWEISGINRKLQMKPQKWVESSEGGSDSLAESDLASIVAPADAQSSLHPAYSSCSPALLAPCSSYLDTPLKPGVSPNTQSQAQVDGSIGPQATELMLVLKWGGDLTPLGRKQAEKLGKEFRTIMYPGAEGGGILRLHATYRHDLKIKASDEGRVMKTAAAFAKGLLELEGYHLAPILASLVTVEENDRQMLDREGNTEIKEEMDRCKEHLNLLQKCDAVLTEELIQTIAPGCSTAVKRAMLSLGNPKQTLQRMHSLIGGLCDQLHLLCKAEDEEEERLMLLAAEQEGAEAIAAAAAIAGSDSQELSLDASSHTESQSETPHTVTVHMGGGSRFEDTNATQGSPNTPVFDDVSVFDGGSNASSNSSALPKQQFTPPVTFAEDSNGQSSQQQHASAQAQAQAQLKKATSVEGIAFLDKQQQPSQQVGGASGVPMPSTMSDTKGAGDAAVAADHNSTATANLQNPVPVKGLVGGPKSGVSSTTSSPGLDGGNGSSITSQLSGGLNSLLTSACAACTTSTTASSVPPSPTGQQTPVGAGDPLVVTRPPSLSLSTNPDILTPMNPALLSPEEMDSNFLADINKLNKHQKLKKVASSASAASLTSLTPPVTNGNGNGNGSENGGNGYTPSRQELVNVTSSQQSFGSDSTTLSVGATPSATPTQQVLATAGAGVGNKSLYLGETIHLMADRWEKLYKDFYSAKLGMYDLSKVPDVYDSIRYEVLHNSHLGLKGMDELFALATQFENTVVPQEYGTVAVDKRRIGSMMCNSLLEKIKHDLLVSCSGGSGDIRYMLDSSHASHLEINSIDRAVRSRLYFTSESHLYTLLNVLRYSDAATVNPAESDASSQHPPHAFCEGGLRRLDEVSELSYLTQVVFRLFEVKNDPYDALVAEDADVNNNTATTTSATNSSANNDAIRNRFRVEISFSPGAIYDPNNPDSCDIAPYILLNKSIQCDTLLQCIEDAIIACDIRSESEAPTPVPSDGVKQGKTSSGKSFPLTEEEGSNPASISATDSSPPAGLGDAAGGSSTDTPTPTPPSRESSSEGGNGSGIVRALSTGSHSSEKMSSSKGLASSPYSSGGSSTLARVQSHRKMSSSGITVVNDDKWALNK